MKLSNRASHLQESATLKMARLASELKASGHAIINLSLGEPDFSTPEFIKEAAKKALDENYTHYTPVPGYQDLRSAIVRKFKRDNGLAFNEEQIVVSTGAKQSVMNVILALVNEGDEVILPAPYWVSYKDMALFAGAKVVEMPTHVDQDFKITADELEKSLSEKVKLFIFSNPCNPSGSVYSKKELEYLVSVFKKFPELVIISDEIYEHINYQKEHTSLASFKEIQDQVVTVNGLSKAFAMTGWRLGYIAAEKEIAKACSKIQGQFTSGTNSIAQRAAITALEADPKVTYEMKKAFLERKKLFREGLSKLNGFKVNDPDGAFYLFPDISSFFGKEVDGMRIENSFDFSMFLLEKCQIATTPGAPFGSPNNIRFSYAASTDELEEALIRLKRFFS